MYWLKRSASAALLAFAVLSVTFFLLELAPGSYAETLLQPNSPPETRKALIAKYHLDQPVHQRYLAYIGNMLHGDFGISFSYNKPVTDVIAKTLPNTLWLTLPGLLLALLMGIPLGIYQALHHHSTTDRSLLFIQIIGYSVPVTLAGMMLQLFFAIYLDWLPVSGMQTLTGTSANVFGAWGDYLHHLILPIITYALWNFVLIARMMRSSMIETLQQDYLRTARSRGLPEWRVLWKHALPNAVSPIVTWLGLALPSAFAGAVITESVFAWPGIGRAMLDAIFSHDIPLVSGLLFFSTLLIIGGQLMADLFSHWIDPRTRAV